jgi:hypothetical protein
MRLTMTALLCAALLAGCQSLEVVQNPPGQEQQPAEPTVVHPRIILSLPRPLPPRSEPPRLQRDLPEPGLSDLAAAEPAPAQVPGGPGPEIHSGDSGKAGTGTEGTGPGPLAPYTARRGRGLWSPPSPPAPTGQAATRPVGVEAAGPRAGSPVSRSPAQQPEPARAPQAASAPQPAPAAQAAPKPQAAPAAQVASAPKPAPAADTRPPAVGSPERERRELLARRGDRIAIDMEGSGWIYVGLKPDRASGSSPEPGIRYLSGRSSQGKTSFIFEAADYGQYELSFQLQDNQRALVRSQTVSVKVLPEEDFQAALDGQRQLRSGQEQVAAAEPAPGPRIDLADRLFDLGEYDLALVEYTRNMRSGDPYLNDRLAACYEATGQLLPAVKYYRRNLGLEGVYGDRAAVGLVRAGIALKDSRLLLEVMPSLFALQSMPIGGELLEVARFQAESGAYRIAIEALQQYVRRYPDGNRLDEAYYRLAGAYEVDSPYRDLELARGYYQLLYESFPESLYAGRAEARLDYLDRHFFLIQ